MNIVNFIYRTHANILGSPDDLGIPQNDVETGIQTILNNVYFIAGVVAVVVIIIGGMSYITSSGDSSKVTKAKNMIVYAVVGLVLTMLAFGITNFVIARAS